MTNHLELTPLEEVTGKQPTPNRCLEKHDEATFFLECVTLDGRVHGFPYSHLSNYLLEPNPALEHASDAPPERLSLWFSTHQVLILGWRLDEIRSFLHKASGITIKAADSRYANLDLTHCHVSEVAVLSTQE